MDTERNMQNVHSATRVAGMMLVFAVVVLVGLMWAGVAQAQVAGLDQFLIRPQAVVLDLPMTALQAARMREVPTRRTLLGMPSVRYSFGEFVLTQHGQMPGTESSAPNASETSDQGHANTDPANLKWGDFVNALWMMTPVKDQGQRGTCHAEAATGLMEAQLKMFSTAGGQFAGIDNGQPVVVAGQTYHITQEVDLSVQWLEFATKKRADNGANGKTGDGGDPYYDLETLRLAGGHVPEVFWPYNPEHWENDPAHAEPNNPNGPWNWKLVAQTTDGNAPHAVQEAISRRDKDPKGLLSYSVINDLNHGDHETGLTYLKSQLASPTVPVIISIPWPTSRMIANGCVLYVPDAVKNKSETDLWNDTEYDASQGRNVSKWFEGGHCIVVVGVGKAGTPAEGLFAIKNSWSRWWGKNGYGFISEAYLKKCLDQTVFCEVQSK